MSVKPARDVDQELVIVADKEMPNLYVVKYKNCGTTPPYLEGLFSTRIAAKKRIFFYENRKVPQEQQYKGKKTISKEEEARLYEEVKKKVEAENNGKERNKKTKNKAGTK